MYMCVSDSDCPTTECLLWAAQEMGLEISLYKANRFIRIGKVLVKEM